MINLKPFNCLAHLARAVEYTDCISEEVSDTPTPTNECPGCDTKEYDGEAPVILKLLGNAEYPFIAIAPRSTLAWSGSV